MSPKSPRKTILRNGAALMAAAFCLAAPIAAHAQEDDSNSQAVIRDTEVETFLKANTRPVLVGAGLDPDKVHYLLIASDDLNAFSTFRLVIGLNTGLIMAADNPNQLFGT
jgi:predicted Zn-dependent protease